MGNRLLQQFQPQVAALAHAAQPDRLLRRVALVGVRAQHDLRAYRHANRRQPLHVVFRDGAHLGLEPAHPLLHPFGALARHAVGGAGGHLHHREHLPAPAAADQVAHRDAERLAKQVVQRQVDSGLRTRVCRGKSMSNRSCSRSNGSLPSSVGPRYRSIALCNLLHRLAEEADVRARLADAGTGNALVRCRSRRSRTAASGRCSVSLVLSGSRVLRLPPAT